MNVFLRLAGITAMVAISYSLLRKFIAGGVCTSTARMSGRVVLITGANSGIGKATAVDLTRRGARVIMACRDLKRGEAALNSIVEETGSSNVILKHLNLASMKSIRAFAKEINTNEPELHVLINNAGVIGLPKREETEDGLELTMAVNHFGHFLLTNLLLDLLKKSAPSRIVVVSSIAHHNFLETLSPFRFDNMHSEKNYRNLEAYGQSKLANILFTRELARRINGSGVTANSLHPGISSTGLANPSRLYGLPENLGNLMRRVLSIFFKTPEQGAQTSIHLAVSEEVEGISGRYFIDCEEREPAKTGQDDVAAKKLWEISAEIVGMQDLIAEPEGK
ncbi:retinol dehydrogenase 12-like [Dendronephthya gigantea]|uniref:retinol dehydrogenase 12-like n=1 Tax=Dendronephthya gigantea TaxID=151771 RepID=UPI0010692E63|nr:retinol dehydrogenase 12-like [Dendronephthya gigantea]